MVATSASERRKAIDLARAEHAASRRRGAIDATISASWERSRRLGTTPASTKVLESVAMSRWAASPVNRYAGDALNEFAGQVNHEGFAAAFVDADGLVLWSAALHSVARAAERSGFLLGSNWSEESVGTNGPGTAMATGQAVTVFANEHWNTCVHDWVCYAAPVRNRFGEVVGALDISTDWKHESGIALATVRAMSKVVEQLISDAPVTSDSLRVRALGTPSVVMCGVPVRLSPRQLEIVVILATAGACSLDELHDRLYGERQVSKNTTKAEISNLRRLFGSETISSRPYRIEVPVDLDVVHLHEAVARGDLETATRLYTGTLLPLTESAEIISLRHNIEVVLRNALLQAGSAKQLRRYARVHPFDSAIAEAAQQRD